MDSGAARGRLCRIAGLAVCASLASLAASGTKAGAAGIAPHRAFYEVALVRAGPSAGLEAISGATAFEWSTACDREVASRETRLLVRHSGGGEAAVRIDFQAWESSDGAAYGFAGKTTRDGAATQERRGTATLAASGGKAVYSKPGARRMALPPGTLFPGAWIREVIGHARDGNGLLTRRVFFGENEDDLLTASVLVLPDGADAEPEEIPEALQDIASWRARIAFFSPEGGSTPAFESTERIFENGVGGDAVVAFPDFTVRYRLKKLELLDRPEC